MKKIASLGIQFEDEDIKYISYRSNDALMDFDILIIGSCRHNRPQINAPYWSTEIKRFLDQGKNIYVFNISLLILNGNSHLQKKLAKIYHLFNE